MYACGIIPSRKADETLVHKICITAGERWERTLWGICWLVGGDTRWPRSAEPFRHTALTPSRCTEKVKLLWALGTGHHYYNHSLLSPSLMGHADQGRVRLHRPLPSPAMPTLAPTTLRALPSAGCPSWWIASHQDIDPGELGDPWLWLKEPEHKEKSWTIDDTVSLGRHCQKINSKQF